MKLSMSVLGTLATCLLAAGCASELEPADEGDVEHTEDPLLAGRRLSEAETAQLLRNAGFPESAVGPMVCTAKYESSFYERATNSNTNGSIDRGLFQINSIHVGTPGCPSAAGLFDAAQNTHCALKVYQSQGINAWYGYQHHRAECGGYRAPGGGGGGGGGGDCSVHADGRLYCDDRAGTPMHAATNGGSPVVNTLRTAHSWFDCWGTGERHAGGNTTWYHTLGDDNGNYGWVPGVALKTPDAFDANPGAHGLKRCP
ncbi:MAG: hypothetical protein JWP87_2205 [Labilithrix sp.]|nr:hypothetical protein [Labilithrix sp.]